MSIMAKACFTAYSDALIANRDPEATLIPSLYPIYLFYKTQHQILSKVQFILEECCFKFATSSLPEAILARGWEYPESAELTQWTKLLLPREEEVPASAVSKIPGRSWQEVLLATNKIRHSAVHRLHISAKGIQNMLGDATMLTIMLRDTIQTSLLEHIRRELASSIEEVEGRLIILENDLCKELDILAKRRAELSRLQDAAVLRAIDKDRENRRVIGLALGEELKELCSVEKNIPEKHSVNTSGMKAELSEHATSAMSSPAKQMLVEESKGVNGIK